MASIKYEDRESNKKLYLMIVGRNSWKSSRIVEPLNNTVTAVAMPKHEAIAAKTKDM